MSGIERHIPEEDCLDGRNLVWNGRGPYARTAGHWYCFPAAGDGKDNDYPWSYDRCMSVALSRGVPLNQRSYWCGGWPDAKAFVDYSGSIIPSDATEIRYLVPVVLAIVGVGLFVWYRTSA
jgi:hypothetical protein